MSLDLSLIFFQYPCWQVPSKYFPLLMVFQHAVTSSFLVATFHVGISALQANYVIFQNDFVPNGQSPDVAWVILVMATHAKVWRTCYTLRKDNWLIIFKAMLKIFSFAWAICTPQFFCAKRRVSFHMINICEGWGRCTSNDLYLWPAVVHFLSAPCRKTSPKGAIFTQTSTDLVWKQFNSNT